MKNYVLDPLGDLEVLDETFANWHITDYKKLPDRSYSPEFECGGYKWYHDLMVFANLGESYSFLSGIFRKNPPPHISKLSLPQTHQRTGTCALSSR